MIEAYIGGVVDVSRVVYRRGESSADGDYQGGGAEKHHGRHDASRGIACALCHKRFTPRPDKEAVDAECHYQHDERQEDGLQQGHARQGVCGRCLEIEQRSVVQGESPVAV